MGTLKILYIGGASFSGSTFLGAALAQHPSLTLTGELIGLLTRERTHKCSCGKRFDTCDFWQRVLQTWEANSPIGWETYRRLATRYERIRGLRYLLWQPTRRSQDFKNYAAATHAFLEAIAKTTGTNVLVDISKYPTRALALQAAGLDVVFIHLTRNGLAYLESNTRHRYEREYAPKGWPRWLFWVNSALEWDFINLLCLWTRRKMPSLHLRYENFVREPHAAFSAIGNLIEIPDLGTWGQALQNGTEIAFGHSMGGNLIRLQGPARLAPNQEWEKRITSTQRQIYRILSAWLSRRLGY